VGILVRYCKVGPRSSVFFSLKCKYCIWLGPRSSMCFSLECKYYKVGSHVQSVFWFWNASIARLGPMSNVCFDFEMQVLQSWVPSPMCV
jgi:hypothetical protein